MIGGEKIYSGDIEEVRAPHDTGRLLARIHRPSEQQVRAAIQNALAAARDWAALPFEKRATVFLRAAEIVARVRRHKMTAATMLGQRRRSIKPSPTLPES